MKPELPGAAEQHPAESEEEACSLRWMRRQQGTKLSARMTPELLRYRPLPALEELELAGPQTGRLCRHGSVGCMFLHGW